LSFIFNKIKREGVGCVYPFSNERSSVVSPKSGKKLLG